MQIPWWLRYETGTTMRQHVGADGSRVSLSDFGNKYGQAYKWH